MKKIILLLLVIMMSCSGDNSYVLRDSVGRINKVLVVTKSSNWLGDIGTEIKAHFGELMVGLPQPEPTMRVSQVAPNGFGTMMKVSRNIFVVDENKPADFKITYNVYAQPQTIVYLSGQDDDEILAVFNKHKDEILETFLASDIQFLNTLFTKKKVDESQYKTLQNIGVSMTIPNTFKTVDDTGEFLWLRQHLSSGIAQTGSNNILVYSVPLEEEAVVANHIINVRNTIGKKYIPGSDPKTMYMITEEAYTPVTVDAIINGKKAYETRGKWEVKNDFMAGPFLNYTIIDKKNNRLIVFEGFTYAPSINKRAFVFELEAIGKSIKIL